MSPFLAYNFSELIESHAVDTYTEFAEVNKELLQSLPPTPQVRGPEKGQDETLEDESARTIACKGYLLYLQLAQSSENILTGFYASHSRKKKLFLDGFIVSCA